mgnify:FL=1
MDKRNNLVRVMITGNKSGQSAIDEFTEIYREAFDVMKRDFSNFEEALEAAAKMNMTHMLYFKDTNLILASLADEMGGYSLDITVDDLRRVLS